jgi:hypothetical protein
MRNFSMLLLSMQLAVSFIKILSFKEHAKHHWFIDELLRDAEPSINLRGQCS